MTVLQRKTNRMIRFIIGNILLSFVIIFCSCSEKGAVDEKQEAINSSGERTIRIVFNLPGDDIGAPQYRDILSRIIISIRSEKAGEIVSYGFGMGNMEMTIKVKGEDSIESIKRIIIVYFPEADYRISKSLPFIPEQ